MAACPSGGPGPGVPSRPPWWHVPGPWAQPLLACPFVHPGPTPDGSASSPWRDACPIGLDFKPMASAEPSFTWGHVHGCSGSGLERTFREIPLDLSRGGCGLSSSGLSPAGPGAPPRRGHLRVARFPANHHPSLALTGEERLLFERSQGGSHHRFPTGEDLWVRPDHIFSAKINHQGRARPITGDASPGPGGRAPRGPLQANLAGQQVGNRPWASWAQRVSPSALSGSCQRCDDRAPAPTLSPALQPCPEAQYQSALPTSPASLR